MRTNRSGCHLVGLCLVGVLAVVSGAEAQMINPPVVISQVYGGGSNTGAPYTHDYVVVFNRSDAPVSLTGWSVQYASATGTGNFAANPVVPLNGTLAPGGSYLVQLSGGATGAPLPAPDATGAINASATAGKFVLVSSTTGLACNGGSTSCSAAQLASIVDLVGYGGANFFEGAAPAPGTSNTTAAIRAGGGCVDTNQNVADFTAAAPAPRNTASPAASCEAPSPKINEFSASTAGTDVEYVEIYGAPNTDYSAYRILEIEGDAGTAVGTVDEVISLGTTNANGLFLVNLPANALENGTLTLLLVKNFSGALNQDLDTNNDGVFDATPWEAIVDAVAVHDGGAGDVTYAVPVLGVAYDGQPFAPGGASRIPDGADTDAAADWVRNDFDLAGIPGFPGTPVVGEALNTPGAPNQAVPPADPCTLTFTPIYQIQGSGPTAAITGPVTTQGVVVGDYEGASPALRGFFMQDLTGDGNAATSDGIFVFNGNSNVVSVGDVVRVTGTAAEFQDQTQVTAASITVCGTGSVAPTDIELPVPSATYLERFEGMLVRFPQALSVTEHFQLGRFGQVVLSSGGRLPQPTNIAAPGLPAQAQQAANGLNRIILDDTLQNQNPDPIVFGRGGQPLSAGNTLRGGDTVTDLVGVMTYTWSGNEASGNAYRVRPLSAAATVNFAPVNPRPAAPELVAGTLRVTSANVLNYYNTFSGCRVGVTGGAIECRGADNATEFDRQWPKTVAALLGTGADVIGLIEIENDGYGADSALQHLVDRLNAATAPGTWAFVDADAATGTPDVLGSDGIKVALIYKPAVVSPVGQTAVINTGAFGLFQLADNRIQQRNRPALAQSFEDANGARFTVVVNHLISKSASCHLNVSPVGPDPDTGDGQGLCNLTRVAAVQELMAWLATDPTGASDPDILLLGDFNAYAREDPITALATGGFVNLETQFQGEGAYSYVFDGQWGSLDHALASTSLASQVGGVATFHINADEPSVLDYNTNFKSAGQIASLYAPDMYRASDHDPIVVALTLRNDPPVVTAGGPYTVVEGDTVLLEATGYDPDGGPLTYAWDLDDNGTFETAGQTAVYTGSSVGTFTVRVRATDVSGLSTVAPATVKVLFRWSGFFSPVKNPPALNSVKAGSTVTVKFDLNGDHGLGILAAGFPVSLQVLCGTETMVGDGSPTATPGHSGLTYDEAAGHYTYMWKTEKAWAGTCRVLSLQLVDGTFHYALFKFGK